MQLTTVKLSSFGEVAVRRATVLDGIRRGRRFRELSEGIEDPDQVSLISLYVDMTSCSDVADLTLEGFAKMDDRENDVWYRAVRAANPHWFGDVPEDFRQGEADTAAE